MCRGKGRLVAGAQSAVELRQELACGPALLTVALGVVSSTDWGENTAQGTRGGLNEVRVGLDLVISQRQGWERGELCATGSADLCPAD